MAFTGRFDLTIPDILQILSLAKKTGRLRLSRLGNSGEILFKRGKVIYAASDSTHNSLGNILMSQKHLTESALMAALELQHLSPNNKRLGAILLEKGAITPAVLQEAIRYQIEQVIAEFLTWETGFFRFDAMEIASDDGITVDASDFLVKTGMTPEHLLLEGSRRLDEAREAPRPPQATAKGTPAPPPPVQAAAEVPKPWIVTGRSEQQTAGGTLDGQPEAEKSPPRTPGATTASPTPDLPDAGRSGEAQEAQKPPRPTPRPTPQPTADPAVAKAPSPRIPADRREQHTPASPVSSPPTPPATAHRDERREATRPPQATAKGTPAPPPPDRAAAEVPKAQIPAHRREQPAPAAPPLPDTRAEAPSQEFEPPSITEEIALNAPVAPWVLIMHFAADVVGRGVFLSVGKDGITGLDQFGVVGEMESGDERVHGIKIPLDEPSIFTEILNRRKTYRGAISPGKWNEYFLAQLGGNTPHQAVVIPVIVAGKVIAIFYGDDAGTGQPLGEVERLEALIGQTFLAIEMSILEKQTQPAA